MTTNSDRFLYDGYTFQQEHEWKAERERLRRICKHGMRRGGVCVFCGEAVTSLPAESTQKPLQPLT
jgi:hypothetical protein